MAVLYYEIALGLNLDSEVSVWVQPRKEKQYRPKVTLFQCGTRRKRFEFHIKIFFQCVDLINHRMISLKINVSYSVDAIFSLGGTDRVFPLFCCRVENIPLLGPANTGTTGERKF